jgi:GTP-binding protein YchF
MGFRCGIVGLPNVGKSTLFNALTDTAQAEAANYPFCTIEPNVGQVPVPDPRLDRIADVAHSDRRVATLLAFVDIAGLVRGASKGEGLGNQFLANIREVDAIMHVLRCFEDGNVSHVHGKIDPVDDAETVETELMLADMESLERRIDNVGRKARSGEKDAQKQLKLLEKVAADLQQGRPARSVDISPQEAGDFAALQLLSAKPVLYICNVDEASAASGNEYSRKVEEMAAAKGAGVVVISAAIEAELALLEDADEKLAFLQDLGLEETGLARVIRAGYELLDLITFFTAGPNEARAWTVAKGTKAPQAGAIIHTDFERGFIRAETISYDDYLASGGEQGARDAGRLRAEGRDYVVQDGDVILYRFNV